VAVSGLSLTLTDVLVRVNFLNGIMVNHVLRPNHQKFLVPASEPPLLPVYFAMGFRNLLSGFDHILFIIGLFLIASGSRRLIGIFTAFSIAWALTLALSALHVIRLSQPPVEAIIALSVLFLALVLMRHPDSRNRLMAGYLFMMVFCFGLLHGFGFAGALRQIGLPQDTEGRAIVLFVLGVGLGQVGIIGSVLIIRIVTDLARRWIPDWVYLTPVYAMGIPAAYWVIKRVMDIIS
jgi:hydrogenase/urease accessory protein HupE